MARRTLSVILYAAALACLINAGVCAGQAVPKPALEWKKCAYLQDTPLAAIPFACANTTVPLDYTRPNRANITLAVIKLPASSGKPVGTLFLNPGGPGGPGLGELPAWVASGYFPDAITQIYDLVSWDPRGVGQSTAVQCFDTEGEKDRFVNIFSFDNYFPYSPAEVARYIRLMRDYAKACGKRNGELLNYVSTADTARDMDLLRQAVGDAKLTYWGVSYGTFLGATYANLFPDQFRALVLDGVVDADVWFQKPGLSLSLRLNTDGATYVTLERFFQLCGANTPRCNFSAGSAAATRTKYFTLVDILKKRGGIGLPAGLLPYAANWGIGQVTGVVQNQMFTTHGWPALSEFLQALWLRRDLPLVTPTPPSYSNDTSYAGDEQQWSITCGDAPEVRSSAQLIRQAYAEQARSNDNAPLQTWNGDGACLYWPGKSKNVYKGPFNKNTSATILVIGNTYDPATWYGNAVRTATQTLANARLLTIEDGLGHTVLLNPSTCALKYISAYIVNGTLPPVDATCRQDCVPYTPNFEACLSGKPTRSNLGTGPLYRD